MFPLPNFDLSTFVHIYHLVCYYMDIIYRVKRHSLASVMTHKQRQCPLVKNIKVYLFTCRISTTTMRVIGSVEGMWFELQHGTFYLKEPSFFKFFGVCICVDGNPVLGDMTPSQWVIAVEILKQSIGRHFYPWRCGYCVISCMSCLKDSRAMDSWIKYVGMLMSDSVLRWHITNYALERRLPGLLALKMKLLLLCVTSVAIYYSTRRNFPPDLNIQRHCREKLTSRVHITECCNKPEVLPIFAFQPKRCFGKNQCGSTNHKSPGILFRIAAVFSINKCRVTYILKLSKVLVTQKCW
jgi:hypothetical protein